MKAARMVKRHAIDASTAMKGYKKTTRENLSRFIARCLMAVGLNQCDASTTAQLIAKAHLIGQDGHVFFRLPQYVKRI
ncbi:hypothetical protein AB833_19200 [Chromatiales bacterium (ex Bugula neritina AB1)]|nr:hypothetical protein AB833_19200 [Chromatiales bacterium (ex Bugula neritina AB1)]